MANVEKIVLTPIKYVDGVPMSGQSRIDWIQNGEQFGGATSPITNEGELNRAGVKVQENVKIAFENLTTTTDTLNTLIDIVNHHETIINPVGDGSDLFSRMNSVEFKLNTQENSIQSLIQSDITIGLSIQGIKNDIGLVNPEKPYRTVRDELYHIKDMLGNYQDFTQDGTADLNAIGRGVKGQVERNLKSIGGHEVRIQSLEKWWDGKTPDVLIADVAKLRTELGNTPNEKTVYARIDDLEHSVNSEVGLKSTVDKLAVATNLVGFPIVYTDVTGVQTSTSGVYEYAYAVKGDVGRLSTQITALSHKLDDAIVSLGTQADGDNVNSAWGEINELKRKNEYLEGVVGLTETDGIRLKVSALDNREQEHYDRLDNITQNISNTVFTEHEQSIANLKREVFDSEMNLHDMVRGKTGSSTDFELFGVYESARQMFDNMYTPYMQGSGTVLNPISKDDKAAFVRIYDPVTESWVWVDQYGKDYVLTVGKSIKSNNGSKGVGFVDVGGGKEKLVLGDTPVGVRFGGSVENLPLDETGVVKVGSDTVLSKTPDATVIGHGKAVSVVVETSDSVKAKVGSNEYTVINTDNAKRLLDLQDPRAGVNLNAGKSIQSEGYTLVKRDQNTVLVGNEFDKVHIVGKVGNVVVDEADAVKFVLGGVEYTGIKLVEHNTKATFEIGSGNTDVGLMLNNEDMKSLKAIGATEQYTIWHDGLDAPSDGAYYARVNGVWTAFNPGGSGGIGDEAPNNGLQYVRVCESGFGKWEQVGSKTISLAAGAKVTGAVTGGTIDLLKFSDDKTIQVGISTSKTILNGVVDQFKSTSGFIMDDGKNGLSYNKAQLVFSVGDLSTKTILQGSVKIKTSIDEYQVWHDGMDATADGQYYARRNGQWQKVFNGVNPDADVLINQPSSYKIAGQKVGSLRMVGSDYVVSLGQSGQWTELSGNVMSFNLQKNVVNQTTAIRSTTITGNEFLVIAASHNFTDNDHVLVGDPSVKLKLQGSSCHLNGNRVMTTADDAPSDHAKYTRRDGAWERAYYYGDFAVDAPSNPKEGDLFFEFIN